MRKLIYISMLCLMPSLAAAKAKSPQEILNEAPQGHWRAIDTNETIYFELPKGRVVVELAPSFAPNHVANIKTLVREGYFNGSFVVRSQDNFVVQWGYPDDQRPETKKAKKTLKAEFEIPLSKLANFSALPDPDTYAPIVGFADGFPVAQDKALGKAWLVHCYGMVGVGRDNDADSGSGNELYVVDGQSPRNLDRNITVVGRVIEGMELLSSLPRGKGEMGFYQKPEERTLIKSAHVAADLPKEKQTRFEALRTESSTFKELVESRRNRKDDFYKVPAGRIGVCNVPLPVRTK